MPLTLIWVAHKRLVMSLLSPGSLWPQVPFPLNSCSTRKILWGQEVLGVPSWPGMHIIAGIAVGGDQALGCKGVQGRAVRGTSFPSPRSSLLPQNSSPHPRADAEDHPGVREAPHMPMVWQ